MEWGLCYGWGGGAVLGLGGGGAGGVVGVSHDLCRMVGELYNIHTGPLNL